MSDAKQPTISAQVILRSASGKAPDGAASITAETIKDFLPSAAAVGQASAALRAAGFEIGPVVGNSFAISAPQATFEQVFKARLRGDGRGSVLAIGEDGSGGYELPLAALPDSIRRHVAAITFTPPPDFGV
jgi:hypothetical protein